MPFFDSVKKRISKKISKAAHVAAEQIFTEFPHCEELLSTNKLSIKLDVNYEELNDRNQQLIRQGRFSNIPFLIRDEKRQKMTVLTATVEAENGVFITTNDGNAIMYARPPNQTRNCFGKLMHPAPATMFKIMQTPNSHKFLIHSNASPQTPILKIEKLKTFMGKAINLMGTDCVYCFKTIDNTVLGHVRPKFSTSANTLILKFKRTNTDVQIRAIMLGVASLFAITEAYPEIGKMLSHTLKQNI